MRVDLQARPLAVFALATTPVLCCIVGLVIFARKCGDFEIDHPDPRCWTGVHPPTLIAEVPAAHQPDPALHACTAVAARRINDRYRLAVTPSNRLDEAGVLIHHFDTWENPQKWWQGCPADCASEFPLLSKGLSGIREQAVLRKECGKCRAIGDRFSATTLFRGMFRADRPDRRVLPIVTGHAGMVLRANATKLLCVFGTDGETRQFQCPDPPISRLLRRSQREQCVAGCGNPPAWCRQERVHGGCKCGFDRCEPDHDSRARTHLMKRPEERKHIRPWRPNKLGWVLNEYARSGAIGRGPGSFSGYPELVVDSRNIASAVEAIFFPAATRLENVSAVIACRVQRTFVRELRRSACEVPVLRLHPERTEQPFEDWTEQCAQTAAAVSPRQA